MAGTDRTEATWGHHWRSSNAFILGSMSMALFTDEMLFAFMVPLLPYIFEHRIGLDVTMTQRLTSVFLVEGALVSIVSSPFIGDIADRVHSKKVLLLVLLVLTLITVLCLSITNSLIWLFIGRFFQSLVSHALYIVSMATMAENIGSEHMGKIAGLSSTLSAAGTCFGPVIAGFMFGVGGYWASWAGAIAFLVVDIIMRLLMIEKPSRGQECDEQGNSQPDQIPTTASETAPLLSLKDLPAPTDYQGWRFYTCLFRKPRFSAGIFCYFVFSLLVGSFQTTLAVRVREAFGWGVFPVGFLFAALQGPGMILSPLVGWLKDRTGSRIPTTIGFISLVPFLWLLGAAGDARIPWLTSGNRGKIIYSVCTGLIGCLICLLNGVGTMEATDTIDELETLHPGIFGSRGGYSRAMAVTGMAWMTGLLVGPALAGFVTETFGYFELQCVLAIIALVSALIAVFNLSPGRVGKHSTVEHSEETV